MKKVYIVVEEGLVQAVYADESDVEVELIDLDSTDPAEYEAAMKAFEEMRETSYIVY